LQPDPPPPAVNAVHGRYVGEVTIGGVGHFADALFAPDGRAHVYIGVAGGGSAGLIPSTRPPAASQFVGRLALEPGQAAGDGVIIAEGCALVPQPPNCGVPAAAALRFPGAVAGFSDGLVGSLDVVTATGTETWPLALSPWDNYYVVPVQLPQYPSQYIEQIAEFSENGDTILTIDAAGAVFFQSAGTGCTANGHIEADTEFNVLDVSLELASCNGAFAYLNGDFSGVGTFSASNYWNYDTVLRLWLARSGMAGPPAALTLWSLPIYE
jgi:hypothetical protein